MLVELAEVALLGGEPPSDILAVQGHAGHHFVDPGAVGKVTFETDMADPNASSSTDAAASTAAKTARPIPVWTASSPGCVQRRAGARVADAVRHGFVAAGQGDDARAVLRTGTQDVIRTDATGSERMR
ncbi:hypothetical protein ACFV4Q_24205 [Streptomyces nojiriensis]|uniref:hypothetical protein n=1 Tax=Streptomyces nojiriensis TaxID=66374 RepID=UPI0036648C67